MFASINIDPEVFEELEEQVYVNRAYHSAPAGEVTRIDCQLDFGSLEVIETD